MAKKKPVFKQYDEFVYARRASRGPVDYQKWLVKLPAGNYIYIEAINEGQLQGKLNQLKILKKTSGG